MNRLLLLSSTLSLLCLAQLPGDGAAAPAQNEAASAGQTRAAESDAKKDAGSTASTGSSGPTRIDFDDRLVQGQTNQAGSIYLFDRTALPFEPMVEGRKEFRSQLREQVYGK